MLQYGVHSWRQDLPDIYASNSQPNQTKTKKNKKKHVQASTQPNKQAPYVGAWLCAAIPRHDTTQHDITSQLQGGSQWLAFNVVLAWAWPVGDPPAMCRSLLAHRSSTAQQALGLARDLGRDPVPSTVQ